MCNIVFDEFLLSTETTTNRPAAIFPEAWPQFRKSQLLSTAGGLHDQSGLYYKLVTIVIYNASLVIHYITTRGIVCTLYACVPPFIINNQKCRPSARPFKDILPSGLKEKRGQQLAVFKSSTSWPWSLWTLSVCCSGCQRAAFILTIQIDCALVLHPYIETLLNIFMCIGFKNDIFEEPMVANKNYFYESTVFGFTSKSAETGKSYGQLLSISIWNERSFLVHGQSILIVYVFWHK